MVLINKATNEITAKLVYYGPGLCGKTTNLEHIYGNPKIGNKGKMISMATETDRTLFFDFMPMELGTIGGQKVRVQLYTVPGQVFYDATRKLVLRGADGVVFVADSQQSMQSSNIDSLANLRTNLRLNRLNPEKIALVYQANKRDLPNVSGIDEMRAYLEVGDAQLIEAVALEGKGVSQTLRAAITQILENLRNQVNYKLTDDEAIAVQSSADASAESIPVVSAGGGEAEVGAGPVEVPEPPPAESPFSGDVTALTDRDDDGAELQALHVRSQELMRTLESALELARSQEERISRLMEK